MYKSSAPCFLTASKRTRSTTQNCVCCNQYCCLSGLDPPFTTCQQQALFAPVDGANPSSWNLCAGANHSHLARIMATQTQFPSIPNQKIQAIRSSGEMVTTYKVTLCQDGDDYITHSH
jgi:hypothetical protein